MNLLRSAVALGRAVIVMAALAAAAGCDVLSDKNQDGRFEFRQDAQGRILRLDRSSGELMLVDGTKLVPVTGPATAPPRASVAASRASKSTQEPTVTQTTGPDELIGMTLRSTSPNPVFEAPGSKAQVALLPAGSRLTVLARQNDWYQVQFAGERGHQQMGFIPVNLVDKTAPPARAAEPVDLSIPDFTPSPKAEPIDLSLPDFRETSPR